MDAREILQRVALIETAFRDGEPGEAANKAIVELLGQFLVDTHRTANAIEQLAQLSRGPGLEGKQ